ncbi:SGNH/GDSL hydrolase family protein [Klebsiella michiganensis]|uniref:SGNH/GDSL hydrolase family protein n=1 Tax=Klebsiella michiganensis TaxID=1134687 RepID=UPI001B842931|nr:SGNH/GDSL hydrolase family protein [Klebsiella michiganensis]MBR7529913.1 SGNH/GDSL hydrolase family protein [Klebsiella michiganensis]MBR7569300.1 SGNH/GDSL hydrolase family protein [Klebsiella michiganensis]
MSNSLAEESKWEPAIYQLEKETPVLAGPGGPDNIQASQLANRTQWLRVQIVSAQDYREYTFFKSESDPDGTISGLANTPSGKMFRVVQGLDDELSFIYYLNYSGTAIYLTALLGRGSITNNVREYSTYILAQNDVNAGNILVGSKCWVENTTDKLVADEYINNGGILEPTGRKIPSQNSIDAVFLFINKFITSGAVSGDFFPFFVDGASNVPVYWDNGFAVSRIATSLYQMIYADVHARLGDALNKQVTGVSPGFFPLFTDSAGNVPVYWDGGLCASAISTGLLEKIWAYINSIIADALNMKVTGVSPDFVPGMRDGAGNVLFWFHDGEFDTSGFGPNIRGEMASWFQRRMYTSAYNTPLHTDGRTLWRWKAKKAQLKTGQATRPHFMLTGDSWTQNNELATAIASLLHDDYGDAGLGWRTVNYGAARDGSNIFRSAGWDLYDSSPTSGAPLYGCGIDGQSINTTTATAYFNVTNVRCTDCRIYYQDLNGKFQYGYDVGGVTQWTEVVCGNTGTTKSVLLTGMPDETRTIYVKTDGNAGRVVLHGFYLWRSDVAGCVMSKAGNAGILADQFLLFFDKISEYLSTMQPDVICIVIGNNDYRISESTATFRTALQTYMAACRAVLPDVGFILMAPPRTNGTAVTPLVDFRDVMYDLSQSLNCEFFSIYDLFDTWTKMNSMGCFVDNLHPSATGSNLIASTLNTALIKG